MYILTCFIMLLKIELLKVSYQKKKKVWYQYTSLFIVKRCKKDIFKVWNIFWKGRMKHLIFYLSIATLLSVRTNQDMDLMVVLLEIKIVNVCVQ